VIMLSMAAAAVFVRVIMGMVVTVVVALFLGLLLVIGLLVEPTAAMIEPLAKK